MGTSRTACVDSGSMAVAKYMAPKRRTAWRVDFEDIALYLSQHLQKAEVSGTGALSNRATRSA